MIDTKPATEADVVGAMFDKISPWPDEMKDSVADALTAARALGVLLPEEAAALRRDAAVIKWQGEWKDMQAARDKAWEERDALAARLNRAEEALRAIATMDAAPYVSGTNGCASFCEGYDMAAGSAADTARAALAQPGEVGT